MFDQSAIQELTKAEAIGAAADVLGQAIGKEVTVTGHHGCADSGLVALPEDFKLHDLEGLMPARRRMRGAMTTSSLEDFASYVQRRMEEGAEVFVSGSKAKAVLNLGIPVNPGHADSVAVYEAVNTAAFTALMRAVDQPLGQRAAAEYLEDWADTMSCQNSAGEDIPVPRAVAAVRKLTIEALIKKQAEEKTFSTSRSAFEQVEVTGQDTMPAILNVRCVPYAGFNERTFRVRVGVLSGEKDPKISLRIIKREEHTQEMEKELADKVVQVLEGDLPVIVGSYVATR